MAACKDGLRPGPFGPSSTSQKGGMGRAEKGLPPYKMTPCPTLKPIPELTQEQPSDRLIEFYRKLGWDGRCVVDPSLVRLHEDDLRRIVAGEMSRARAVITGASDLDIAVGVGFLWLNQGPSGGGGVLGLVELHSGWQKESGEGGGAA